MRRNQKGPPAVPEDLFLPFRQELYVCSVCTVFGQANVRPIIRRHGAIMFF